MDGSNRTPLQARVAAELLDLGGPRPTFPPGLGARLRQAIDEELAGAAAELVAADAFVSVNKGALAKVLQCERHHIDDEGFPGWTAANARGTVAHKAIELGAFSRTPLPPFELVDQALQRIIDDNDEWSPADWLASATEAEQAELRSGANEFVAAFQDCFPTLPGSWRPRLESPVKVELFDGRINLRSKVDLKLGQANGHEARVLLLDVKTGRPAASHADDLRFYALLETMKIGVPPFRVASLYLETGDWHCEDITEDILDVAVRRVVGGVGRLVELQLGQREPTFAAGPTCNYCRLRDTCEGAVQWADERDRRGLDPIPSW